MSYFPSLDVVANDFFSVNSIPKQLPIDRMEMMIETQLYTTELSMIESNGPACWEGKWGFERTNEHRRERAQNSNKFMLSWYITQ